MTAALTACVAAAPEPAALPPGVEVELFQLRSDVADRSAQMRVINGSDEDVIVESLRFDDDWFDGEAVRERTSTIPAGRTVDLRFTLPESACDEEPTADERTSSVIFELEGGDVVTLPVTDTLGFTTLMHEKECLRHDLAQVATLAWTSFTASESAQPAALELTVTPTGGDGIAELVEVQTTNLLQFDTVPAPFPLVQQVAGTDAATTVSLPILPLRCDPHAVMEDKRGTVFNVAVKAGGLQGVVEVAASEEMRGAILRWVSDWCDFGAG
ncbi:hypothetical protein LG299_09110 [Microbacterium lacus]|uniref:hypothetical protein n=1 Tax=Microbacterium lacus TaxID=415217 RepID=UPI00384B1B2A